MSNNFGAAVSLPGFSVETAGDSNLYFSSSWPIMKIDENLSNLFTIDGSGDSEIFTHNLGYPPFTMVFLTSVSPLGVPLGYIGPAYSVNSSTITINQQSTYGGMSGHFYIFRNPLNLNFQAPQINLANPPAGTGNEDFGIKFSKPGKDVSSTDLRDFTIHSGTRSLMVYQTVYQPLGKLTDPGFGGDIGLDYNNTLPYDPVFFAFYSSDRQNFQPLTAVSQVAPKIDFNSITSNPFINAGPTGSGYGVFYIMLDPYITTNQLNITL